MLGQQIAQPHAAAYAAAGKSDFVAARQREQ
jgi:hypothetical protein